MSTEAKVGLFVVIAAVLLIGTVYYVGNEQWGHHVIPYRTYLRYAGGVEPGSAVLFGGITVGRVAAVRAWNEDPTEIELLLEVKEGTPINANCTARLGALSLMSSPAISITTGSNHASRLKPGDVISSEETVSIDEMARKLSGIADTAQGLIAQVQGELKGVGEQANTLLANLNETTGSTNRRQIAEILSNTNKMIAQQSSKIDRITDQVLTATQDADIAVKRVAPLLDRVDATVGNVNSTIEQARESLHQDLLQMQSTMEQARSLMASMQTIVRSNDGNIRETMENVRVATEGLAQLSTGLKDRPWSLVRIRQPKDRKVPEQSSSPHPAPSAH
ncbi:MAG: MlaD family protein [Bryobacteraceae bacterium]|jgi:phospholipid/cholesterol/gamma-HCH transport system substrate-binding protein